MGPKKTKVDSKSSSPAKAGRTISPAAPANAAAASSSSKTNKQSKDVPSSAGYLISCDVPTKQYIQHLDELKPLEKRFIIEDLDATHLLVKKKAKDEIMRKVDGWMDEVRQFILVVGGGIHPFFKCFEYRAQSRDAAGLAL
jgi:TFIIH basal transcription factor complex TTD-A subunit